MLALGGLGDTVGGRDYGRDSPERSTGYVIHDVAHWACESAMARAIELWHRYPGGLPVPDAPRHARRSLEWARAARTGRGLASRTGSLEVVIAYDDDLSVAELGDVGRYPSSSVHRRERVRVLAVEDQVPVLAGSRSCIDPVRNQFGQKGDARSSAARERAPPESGRSTAARWVGMPMCDLG